MRAGWFSDVTLYGLEGFNDYWSHGEIGEGLPPFKNEYVLGAVVYDSSWITQTVQYDYRRWPYAQFFGIFVYEDINGLGLPALLMDADYETNDILDYTGSEHSGWHVRQVLPSPPPFLSDPVGVGYHCLIGAGVDSEVRGGEGGSGEGTSEDPAELYFILQDDASIRYLSREMQTTGVPYRWPGLTSPDPLVLGNNAVEISGMYVEAEAHGAGNQEVAVELVEYDDVTDDLLAALAVIVSRPGDVIRGCAVPMPDVLFNVFNDAGIVGEEREGTAQLYYQYDPGIGSAQSDVVEVRVAQPRRQASTGTVAAARTLSAHP